MKSKHPAFTPLVLTGKPERARTSQHLIDLIDAYQARPFPPGVYDVTVRHDPWCALLKNRGPCNCNPDIEMK